MALLALKYVKQRLTQTSATQLAEALERALADPGARELGHQVERLYGTTRSRRDIELMATVAADGEDHRAEEGLMTYAEELLREDRQEGRREGELQGRRAVLLRQMTPKFALTDHERQRILSCEDPDALDAALDKVVLADDKGVVLSELG